MKNLQLDNATALKIYPTAIPELKAVLEQSFGKEFFSGKITDRVKTFEDACAILGVRPCDVTNAADEPDETAYKKLKVIARALNEDWKADFADKNQAKYYPWFEFKKGTGFVFVDYDFYITVSHVGSRLCFRSRELAEYAARQFQTLYNQFLN